MNGKIDTILLPFPEKGERKVWVYVPEHNDGDTLPVVYMTDGQNLFDDNATPYGSWEVVKTVEQQQKSGFSGAVLVGIDNGNIWRDSELTPKCIGEVQLRHMLADNFTPEGEIFDNFVMNTVVPYVEAHYLVKTDRKNTAVCGSSSGGLMAFYLGVEHSEKFSIIGALSPAFLCYTESDWRKYLLEKITDNMPYLYIYTGGGDELEQMIFNSVEMMYDLLPEVGYPYEMMNEVVLFENQHNEKAWAEIFPDFLHKFIDLQDDKSLC